MPSFGRYTLVRRVGIGGMAEIWKAKVKGPEGFSKTIAIKKVLPHLSEDKVFLRMFIEEAKLVASLVHPNVVQVFDFGEASPGSREFYIAMEYVAGANLAEVLIRLQEISFKLSPELALYVTLEVCKGLGYAHHMTDEFGTPMSIVHRDVSPQNVLISYGGEVKITDFGIAKIESAISHTAEGQVRGKLAYMSPEQASGKQIDGRSDLFSLGVMLYELMTGRRLFQGNSGAEIYTQVVSFTSLDQATISDIPLRYQALLSSVLQPDPEKRIRNAQELELALTHALGPGVAIARVSLAELVQRLFAEERAIEMQPIPSESVAVQEPMKMGGIFTSGEDLERLEEKTLTSPAANQPSPMRPDSLAEDVQSGTMVSPSASMGSSAEPAPLVAGKLYSGEDDDEEDEDKETHDSKEKDPFAEHLADKPAEKEHTRPAPAASGASGRNMLPRMGMLAVVCIAGILLTWRPWQTAGGPSPATPTTTQIVQQTANPSPTFSVLPLLADEDTPTPVKPTPAPTRAPRTPVAAVSVAPATPRPTRTPNVQPTQMAEQTPRPTPRQTAAVKQTPAEVANNSGSSQATLSVAARPWVQVWVDGKQVAAETPLRNYAIAAGPHNLRFVNPAVNFDVQKAVNIPRDGKTSVFVDVPSGNVRVTE